MLQIDAAKADNMIATISAIADILEAHNAYGSWQLTFATSRGICEYQGVDNIFKQLLARGHEIAIHIHNQQHIQTAYDNLRDYCGITPLTISGFEVTAAKAAFDLAQQIFSQDIQIAVSNGLIGSTGNLSDEKTTFSEGCNGQFGFGNDMAALTGNYLFPWKPDYSNNNICDSDPQGNFVLLDHVSATWMLKEPSGMVDVLGPTQFARLEGYLDHAIEYIKQNQSDRIAAWGFVTHIIEYSHGSEAENLPDPDALAALDSFLDEVDGYVAGGLVVYTTAPDIIERFSSQP
jgi:hypothetical protein